jgi:hypothetical protein
MNNLQKILLCILCFVIGFMFCFLVFQQKLHVENRNQEVFTPFSGKVPLIDAKLLQCTSVDQTKLTNTIESFLDYVDVINNGSNSKNNPNNDPNISAIDHYFNIIENINNFILPCPDSTTKGKASKNTLNIAVLTDIMNNKITANADQIANAYNILLDKSQKLNTILSTIKTCLKPSPSLPTLY